VSVPPIYAAAGTASEAPDPDRLAGWWRRVGATLVDGLVLTIPLLVIVGVAGGPGIGPLEVIIAMGFFAPLLTSIYAPLLLMRRGVHNGQTLGKQALGIRVVRGTAQPVTFGAGALRELIGKTILGFVPFYGLVDSLFPLGDGNRQALHDKVASTYVVRGEPTAHAVS
jgi:uncharacterized RDD family membrane protein YckC